MNLVLNFSPFPILQTERCKLRQLKFSDDTQIFKIRSDENNAKYLDRASAGSIDDAREFIGKVNKAITNNELIYWGISFNGDSKIIGTICLWKISTEESKAEIGFELLPDYQVKGVMQEVLPVIIKYGFENMGLLTIEGEVDPQNLKSINLMKKFGFEYNRKLKSTVVYSLVNI